MLEPMKTPLTEVSVKSGGKLRRYIQVPSEKLKPILVLLKKYEEHPVSWRESAAKRMADAGGEAAYMLKTSRQMMGLTQADLAKKLGMPQGNISQIESGKRMIGKALAKRLAKIFNLDYRVFL